MKSKCKINPPDELGRLCLTPSQIPTIFNSGEGLWGSLACKWLNFVYNIHCKNIKHTHIHTHYWYYHRTTTTTPTILAAAAANATASGVPGGAAATASTTMDTSVTVTVTIQLQLHRTVARYGEIWRTNNKLS